MNPIICAAAAGILLAMSVGVSSAESRDDYEEAAPDSVELEDIVVTAKPGPLDAAMLRLRVLLDTSAPCLGCDANAAPTRENVVMGLVRFVLMPSVPPEPDEAGRVLSGLRCDQAGPGMDYRCP